MTHLAGAPPTPPPPASGAGLHPLSIGRTLELTLGMLRFRWRLVFGAALLPLLPVHAAASLIQIPFLQTMNRWLIESSGSDGIPRAGVAPPPGWGEALLVLLATGIVLSLAGLVAAAAVTKAAGTVYGGGTTSVRAAVGHGLRRLPSIVGAYLLYLLALISIVLVGAGLSLTFLAGGGGGGLPAFIGLVVLVGAVAATVFVIVRWSLMMPALVLEGAGAMESLGRSWRLVGGSGWRVLGYVLLIALVTGLLGAVVLQLGYAVLGVGAIVTDGGLLLAQGLLSAGVGIMLTPVLPIALTLLYFDLRWRRGELPAS